MKNLNHSPKANPSENLPETGFLRSAARFTREIQDQLSFEIDINEMRIKPATAEILHSNIVIGQIRKADFGVIFHPYQENIKAVQLRMLLSLQTLSNVPKKVFVNFWYRSLQI